MYKNSKNPLFCILHFAFDFVFAKTEADILKPDDSAGLILAFKKTPKHTTALRSSLRSALYIVSDYKH